MTAAARPVVIVCAGGGGVGKTTTSAALATALARSGRRTLVVTIDPARRLADAIGMTVGSQPQPVSLPGTGGRMFALMPDPREALRLFAQYLFHEEPEALERLLNNQLYRVLEEAVPGIHELVCMSFVTRAADDLDLEVIVIDTAPSRFAIDFVTYPRRLGKLLGNRAVAWLTTLGASPAHTESSKKRPLSRPGRWLAWGKRRAERALSRVLGDNAVSDVAGLFEALALVRPRFVDLSDRASDLLLSRETRYLLVAAPTGAAEDNALYLLTRLRKLKIRPLGLIINGGKANPLPWQALHEPTANIPPALRQALDTLEAEREARERVAQILKSSFEQSHRHLLQIDLPYVLAASPRQVVLELADELAVHLDRLAT